MAADEAAAADAALDAVLRGRAATAAAAADATAEATRRIRAAAAAAALFGGSSSSSSSRSLSREVCQSGRSSRSSVPERCRGRQSVANRSRSRPNGSERSQKDTNHDSDEPDKKGTSHERSKKSTRQTSSSTGTRKKTARKSTSEKEVKRRDKERSSSRSRQRMCGRSRSRRLGGGRTRAPTRESREPATPAEFAQKLWKRLETLAPGRSVSVDRMRSPDRRWRDSSEARNQRDIDRLQKRLDAQVRQGLRTKSLLLAVELLEARGKVPQELLADMLLTAASKPGAELFAQTLKLCVAAKASLDIQTFARVLGVLVQRDAPSAQVRLVLNLVIPKGNEPLMLKPRTLTDEDEARAMFEDRELTIASGDEEAQGESNQVPPDELVLCDFRACPELNGIYYMGDATSRGRPLYHRSGDTAGVIFYRRDGRSESGWWIGRSLDQQPLAFNSRESKCPPRGGWQAILNSKGGRQPDSAVLDTCNSQTSSKGVRVSREEVEGALGRINVHELQGMVTHPAMATLEYFSHFCVLMHLEYLADVTSIRRRRQRSGLEGLVRSGWALADLPIKATYGRRDLARKSVLPGWRDKGSEMIAFALPATVDPERVRFSKGDGVTVSEQNPLVDLVGEGLIQDVKPQAIVVQLLGRMPEGDAQRQKRFRLDKSANRTLYERQMAALLQLALEPGALPLVCEMLVTAKVGAIDSWAEELRHRGIGEAAAAGNDRCRDDEDTKAARRVNKIAGQQPKGAQDGRLEKALEEVKGMNSLNSSQRDALTASLSRTCTIIQGPPGTGKTHTSVGVLSLWAKELASGPLLATSDSNVAVDNIAAGLQAKGVRCVRVGRPEKVHGHLNEITLEAYLWRAKETQECCDISRDADESSTKVTRNEDGKGCSSTRIGKSSFESIVDGLGAGTTDYGCCKGSVCCGWGKGGNGCSKGGFERLRGNFGFGCCGKAVTGKGKNVSFDSWCGGGVTSSKGKKYGVAKGGGDLELDHENQQRLRSKDFELQMKILREAEVICTTTISAGGDFLSKLQFSGILIDEVAQATELSTMVPIVLRGGKHLKRLVLVGDHCQLPPGIQSQEAEMRGLSVSVYSRLQQSGIQPFFLDTQYRSHPKLMEFSAEVIYKGLLKSGVTSEQRALPRGVGWPNKDIPVAFVECPAPEEVEGDSKSNPREAEGVFQLLQQVLNAGELGLADVGIVTPYVAQVRKLRQILRSLIPFGVDPRTLEVMSVDGFQGREKDLIIFSAVRSNTRGNLGFLADWRRLNVMLTRARRGLVIFGNSRTLSADPVWRKWLSWCAANGCDNGRVLRQIASMLQPWPIVAEEGDGLLMQSVITSSRSKSRSRSPGGYNDSRRLMAIGRSLPHRIGDGCQGKKRMSNSSSSSSSSSSPRRRKRKTDKSQRQAGDVGAVVELLSSGDESPPRVSARSGDSCTNSIGQIDTPLMDAMNVQAVISGFVETVD